MSLQWNYSELAKSYVSRPEYAEVCVNRILDLAEPEGDACDIGAGTGHLTLPLLLGGLRVAAVEPNAEMRRLGILRTASFDRVAWHDGTAEATGQPGGRFDVVTFGSSFNVCDQAAALREAARILKPGGWFACLWNHRDLDDPLQQKIETIIRTAIPTYDYGVRRQDQAGVIAASGLFDPAVYVEGAVVHSLPPEQIVDAWRSHATLQRQAGERFDEIVSRIGELVSRQDRQEIEVPYHTRLWLAHLR